MAEQISQSVPPEVVERQSSIQNGCIRWSKKRNHPSATRLSRLARIRAPIQWVLHSVRFSFFDGSICELACSRHLRAQTASNITSHRVRSAIASQPQRSRCSWMHSWPASSISNGSSILIFALSAVGFGIRTAKILRHFRSRGSRKKDCASSQS
jgi:hypothetical protein